MEENTVTTAKVVVNVVSENAQDMSLKLSALKHIHPLATVLRINKLHPHSRQS